jgi:hypothetical protein
VLLYYSVNLFFLLMVNISFPKRINTYSIYLRDKLSMIDEFYFSLANGTTNVSTFTPNINTRQQLDTEYAVILVY